jgi:hypothetical protein
VMVLGFEEGAMMWPGSSDVVAELQASTFDPKRAISSGLPEYTNFRGGKRASSDCQVPDRLRLGRR